MNTQKQTMTSQEAAAYVGCEPITIRMNVARGKLKPLQRVGRAWLFSVSEVRRFKSHYQKK